MRLMQFAAGVSAALFRQTGLHDWSMLLRGRLVIEQVFAAPVLLGIGVIYRPDAERQSHYFQARLAR